MIRVQARAQTPRHLSSREVSYAMLSTAMNALRRPKFALKHMPPDSQEPGAAGWPRESDPRQPWCAHPTSAESAFRRLERVLRKAPQEGGRQPLGRRACQGRKGGSKVHGAVREKPEEFGRQDGLSHSYAVEKMRRSRADQRVSANAGC